MAEASSAFAQTLKTVYGFSVLESAYRYVDISLRLSGDIPRANRIRLRLDCSFAESRYAMKYVLDPVLVSEALANPSMRTGAPSVHMSGTAVLS